MKLTTLRKKALRNQLEVEHILGAAKELVPGLADELDRLVVECGWNDGGHTPEGLVIPFRRWALTASTYCRSGSLGLVLLAQNEPIYLSFVFSLLTELHSREALEAVMTLSLAAFHEPATNRSLSLQAAGTFNFLLSFPPIIPVTPEECETIRTFLHRLLPLTSSSVERASVLGALRGVGNEESVRLIAAGTPLTYPWEGVESTVNRVIRKRLKSKTA